MFSLNDSLWSDSTWTEVVPKCAPKCLQLVPCLDRCVNVTCGSNSCGNKCYSVGECRFVEVYCPGYCGTVICGKKKKGFDPIAPGTIDIGF